MNHAGITVTGFKSIFSKQHLAIQPLTILAGANSSGKSSFMQPLLLLKQTLESPGDPGALLLDGPNARFTMASQLLSHGAGKEPRPNFTVRTDLAGGQWLELGFVRMEGKGFDIDKMTSIAGPETIEITQKMEHDAITKILPKPWQAMLTNLGKGEKTPLRWVVRRQRCFLGVIPTRPGESPQQLYAPWGWLPGDTFIPHIQGLIHLPGLRGNPQRTYPKTAGGPDFPGRFEPYVASVIAQWQVDESEKLDDLAKALETMKLTWKVKAEPVDDTQIELKVGRLPQCRRGGAHDLVSIADVGVGLSQSLPVVVALLAAHPGQLVYLEQPEIHLHPLAQRRLADILKDAVQRGVIVVVETHSVLLMREILTLIAKKELPKEDVRLHWLQRDEQGETTVRTAELDDKGAYGDWPL